MNKCNASALYFFCVNYSTATNIKSFFIDKFLNIFAAENHCKPSLILIKDIND